LTLFTSSKLLSIQCSDDTVGWATGRAFGLQEAGCYFVDATLGLAGTRISPFWILLELRMMEVIVTTGAIRHSRS